MPTVTVVHPRGETTRDVTDVAALNAYVINRGWTVQSGNYAAAFQALTGQTYAPTVAVRASSESLTLLSPTDRLADSSRLRITSSQKQEPANNYNGGEVIWLDLTDPRAKAMLTWRLPVNQTTKLPPAVGAPVVDGDMQRIVWAGAHYYAQDQADDNNPTDIHGHWSVEVPDAGLALRTRFEIPFVASKTTGVVGTDKTNIQTNASDLTVRVAPLNAGGASCRLRIAGVGNGAGNTGGYDKVLEFSAGIDGYDDTKKRMQLVLTKQQESGSNVGSNLSLRYYDDAGAYIGAAMTVYRRYGNLAFGGTEDTLYGARLAAIWGRSGDHGFLAQPSAAVSGGAGFAAVMQASSERATQAQVTGDTGWRWVTFADGKMEWGNGLTTSRDVNLYRDRADVLRTDDALKVGAYATTGRPSAATMGVGANIFDTTLNRPIWSNGTAWVDAMGATV